MGKLYIILVLVALSFVAEGASISKTNSNDQGLHELRLVAQADGKSFFAEDAHNKNWTQADNFCKTTGMRLASITSLAQYEALKQAFSPFFSSEYWTVGRDAKDFRQFIWDNISEPPASAGFVELHRGAIPDVCLTFSMMPEWRGQVWAKLCSENKSTLCEF